MVRGQIPGQKLRLGADRARRRRHRDGELSMPDEGPPIDRLAVPAAAYSIREFCAAHRLSESMYFKMRAQGLGPREMIVGTRKLISQEAASEWRAAREAANSAKAKQPAPLAPVAVKSKPPKSTRKSAQPVEQATTEQRGNEPQ
jgi:hypothetical protein